MTPIESILTNYTPDSKFFTPDENKRRAYLVEKLLANYNALQDGNKELIDSLTTISTELDDIFYIALNRYRGYVK